MSKNFKEYSNDFFNKIIENSEVPSSDKMYIFKDGGEGDKLAVQNFQNLIIKSEITYLFGNIKVFSFVLKDKEYIAMTNVEFDVELYNSIEEYKIFDQSLEIGMFLSLIKEADLQVTDKLSRKEIEENFLFQQDGKDYVGHSLEDMAACIESINIFELSHDSFFNHKNYLQAIYLILSYKDDYIKLPINSLLPKYREILSTENQQLPYENIFLSMTSIHLKHCFLEIYRCVERLFVLPRTLALKNKLSLISPAMDVARDCYLLLGWKSNEKDAFRKLLEENCHKSFLESFELKNINLFSEYNFEYDEEVLKSKTAEKIAEKIYIVRNSFVHQFHKDDEKSIKNDDLIILIDFLLNFTYLLYDNYKDELI